eukprot:Rhum_TRINITY_DN4611_c0_g1::Rhum_TRINITY_DN4611_c0_g1_i1::g.15040::m.15040
MVGLVLLPRKFDLLVVELGHLRSRGQESRILVDAHLPPRFPLSLHPLERIEPGTPTTRLVHPHHLVPEPNLRREHVHIPLCRRLDRQFLISLDQSVAVVCPCPINAVPEALNVLKLVHPVPGCDCVFPQVETQEGGEPQHRGASVCIRRPHLEVLLHWIPHQPHEPVTNHVHGGICKGLLELFLGRRHRRVYLGVDPRVPGVVGVPQGTTDPDGHFYGAVRHHGLPTEQHVPVHGGMEVDRGRRGVERSVLHQHIEGCCLCRRPRYVPRELVDVRAVDVRVQLVHVLGAEERLAAFPHAPVQEGKKKHARLLFPVLAVALKRLLKVPEHISLLVLRHALAHCPLALHRLPLAGARVHAQLNILLLAVPFPRVVELLYTLLFPHRTRRRAAGLPPYRGRVHCQSGRLRPMKYRYCSF